MDNKENVATYIRHSQNNNGSQLDNVIQSVKDGTVDCVVVKSCSRLSDDPQECESIAKKIVESGAKLCEMKQEENTGEES